LFGDGTPAYGDPEVLAEVELDTLEAELDTLEVAPGTLEGELDILEVTGLHSLEAAGVDT
jgi:hypothetical protein